MSETIIERLTAEEAERLDELENEIRAGFAQFMRTGLALMEIRDRRLYRENFATFDQYCKAEWSFDARRAYHLISSAATALHLTD